MRRLLLTVWLLGVVDQIDSGVASIEWADGSFQPLPTVLLPTGTREGDAVAVRRAESHVVVRVVHVLKPGISAHQPKETDNVHPPSQ